MSAATHPARLLAPTEPGDAIEALDETVSVAPFALVCADCRAARRARCASDPNAHVRTDRRWNVQAQDWVTITTELHVCAWCGWTRGGVQ